MAVLLICLVIIILFLDMSDECKEYPIRVFSCHVFASNYNKSHNSNGSCYDWKQNNYN